MSNPQFDPNAKAWRAAVLSAGGVVQPYEYRALSNFYSAIKIAGVWARLDCFGFMGLDDPIASRTSHKTIIAATNHGALHIPGVGHRTDGSATYLDLGFVPSTNGVALTGSDMGIHIVENGNLASIGTALGSVAASVDTAFFLSPRSAGAQYLLRANSNNVVVNNSTNSTDLVTGYRNGSTYGIFAEGVDKGTASPADSATVLNNKSFFLGCQNSNGTAGTFRANTYRFWGVGGSITLAQQQALTNAVRAFFAVQGGARYYVSAVSYHGVGIGVDATATGSASAPFLTITEALKAAPAGSTLLFNGDPASPTLYNFGTTNTIGVPVTMQGRFALGATLAGPADATRSCIVQPNTAGLVSFNSLILDPSQGTSAAGRFAELNTVSGVRYAFSMNACQVQGWTTEAILGAQTSLHADIGVTDSTLHTTLSTQAAIILRNNDAGSLTITGSTITVDKFLGNFIAAILWAPTAGGCAAKITGNTFNVTLDTGLPVDTFASLFVYNTPNALVDSNIFTVNRNAGSPGAGLRACVVGTNVGSGVEFDASGSVISNNTCNHNGDAGLCFAIDGENNGNAALMVGCKMFNNAATCDATSAAGGTHAFMIGHATNTEAYNNVTTSAGYLIVDKRGIGSNWHNNTGSNLFDDGMIISTSGSTFSNNTITGFTLRGIHITTEGSTLPLTTATFIGNTINVNSANACVYVDTSDGDNGITFANDVYNLSGAGTLGANPWNKAGVTYATLAAWKAGVEPTASGTAP